MKISPARLATYDILMKIASDNAYSSVLLSSYEERLAPKDRALVHEIALGVLRRQLYLDRVIEVLTKKKTAKFDAEVVISLRIGLYQILFLDKIPASAAVDESVKLVQAAKKTSAKGLVNAVLRRAAREEAVKLEFADDAEKIAVETSHPRWLIEKWTNDFGREDAEKLARANNQTPGLAFRLTNKSGGQTVEILAKLGVEFSESKIVAGAYVVAKPNEMLHVYARDGKIYFQEESSQLVGSAVNLQSGEKFLDVCAAPGSKTTLIAERGMRNADFKKNGLIAAGDLHWKRAEFLRENCRRQNSEFVEVLQYNAAGALPFADETFDCVLVDAPCSGTGTLRHNPEIRYRFKQTDLDELTKKQLAILESASKALKKGGRLIYSTCSLEREENETVVESFLAQNPNFRKKLPELPPQFITEQGYVRTFPHRDATDGFFIAQLEKLERSTGR